ncbi:hypothetical protein [Thermospira aquatica]|uniref:Lipoprotein n=1 Tax=Thermospira aquatica TaxID=2828656 RepID=A0AAX3BEP5_9SPIR|nr:hypothetical protein [Thermospira aquatica]URA10583.1 hypothetical protein KDW03_01920 [Thermospira aquatica]
MKQIAKILMVMILLLEIVSCSKERQKEAKSRDGSGEMAEIPGVPEGYFEKWEYFTVDSEIVKEKAKNFFGGGEYKAIWKWDTDGDDKIDYLLVELHPKIVKGIKKGLLIGEDGEIKMMIDLNKGFYTPTKMIEDFKRAGIREGEVGCIRLLYYKKEMIFTKSRREEIRKSGKIGEELGTLYYDDLDRDLKLQIAGSNLPKKEEYMASANIIKKYYDVRTDKVEYLPLSLYFMPEEKYYENRKKTTEGCRKNKSKGIAFDPVNFDPENPEEVSNYIKSLKKE